MEKPALFDEFLAFARTKPAEERFHFMDNQNCALAQFGKHKFGDRFLSAGCATLAIKGDPGYGVLPHGAWEIAFPHVTMFWGVLVSNLETLAKSMEA